MSPGSSTESYSAFAHTGLRENPGKNHSQDRDPIAGLCEGDNELVGSLKAILPIRISSTLCGPEWSELLPVTGLNPDLILSAALYRNMITKNISYDSKGENQCLRFWRVSLSKNPVSEHLLPVQLRTIPPNTSRQQSALCVEGKTLALRVSRSLLPVQQYTLQQEDLQLDLYACSPSLSNRYYVIWIAN
ncbi:hypothetical protein ANN_15369 [Periplaneta americana]|uniref:Uncharacterized protein n=1 Tax=Periplaneta americana TaxID=6978 RepID=A0ABQ8SHB9_PERAM|nr:hypothetical protein ANN_15369 [Periplaneta americana]